MILLRSVPFTFVLNGTEKITEENRTEIERELNRNQTPWPPPTPPPTVATDPECEYVGPRTHHCLSETITSPPGVEFQPRGK